MESWGCGSWCGDARIDGFSNYRHHRVCHHMGVVCWVACEVVCGVACEVVCEVVYGVACGAAYGVEYGIACGVAYVVGVVDGAIGAFWIVVAAGSVM